MIDKLTEPKWKVDTHTRWEVILRDYEGRVYDISAGLYSVSVSKAIGEIGSFTLNYRPTTYEHKDYGRPVFLTEIALPNCYVEIYLHQSDEPASPRIPIMSGFIDTVSRSRTVSGGTASTNIQITGRGWAKVLTFPLFIGQEIAGLVGDVKNLPISLFLESFADKPLYGNVEEMVKQLVSGLFGKPIIVDKETGDEVIPFSYREGERYVPFVSTPRVITPKSELLKPVGASFIGTPQIQTLGPSVTLLGVIQDIIAERTFNDLIFDVDPNRDTAQPVIYLRKRPVDFNDLVDAGGYIISGDEILEENITITDAEIFNAITLNCRSLLTTDKSDWAMTLCIANPDSVRDIINYEGIRRHGFRPYSVSVNLIPEELMEGVTSIEEYDKKVKDITETDPLRLMPWLDYLRKRYGVLYLHGSIALPYFAGVTIGMSIVIDRSEAHKGWMNDVIGEIYNIEGMELSWSFGSIVRMTLAVTRGLFISRRELRGRHAVLQA